jgi:hypothetical protein
MMSREVLDVRSKTAKHWESTELGQKKKRQRKIIEIKGRNERKENQAEKV